MGQSFSNRLRSATVQQISNLSVPVPQETVESIIDDFSYDISTRRVPPSITEIRDMGGDLIQLERVGFDFASFAQALVTHGAFIRIPQYDRMGVRQESSNKTIHL